MRLDVTADGIGPHGVSGAARDRGLADGGVAPYLTTVTPRLASGLVVVLGSLAPGGQYRPYSIQVVPPATHTKDAKAPSTRSSWTST